jgi:ATP/maltotriose-dependent transcriptional regulator MalT
MSQEVTDQLYADLRHLGSIYPKVALSGILGDLVSAQESVYGLLESRRSPNDSRQLYFLAGIAGGMLAKASHDLAEPHAALTHARTAFLCAEQADHAGLMTWIRSLQSLIAYWGGRPAESARYARHAQELASTASGTAGLWAHLSEARALASSGDRDGAHQVIAQAEDLRDSASTDELDEIGGLFTFGPVRQLYYAGDALSWIAEDAAEAADYSTRAVTGYEDRQGEEWAFGDQAGAHANLAIARLALGEPEGAREALAPVLMLPSAQRMNGIVLSARRVSRALVQSSQGRKQAELQDEIEEFCRVPLATLPR